MTKGDKQKKVKTIIYIFNRMDNLKYRFNKLRGEMRDIEGVKIIPYKDIWCSFARLHFIMADRDMVQSRGMRADEVIIDEVVDLTQEQYDYIKIIQQR